MPKFDVLKAIPPGEKSLEHSNCYEKKFYNYIIFWFVSIRPCILFKFIYIVLKVVMP